MKIFHKNIIYVFIAVLFVLISILIVFLFTYKETFKNLDPIPNDFSSNTKEAITRKVLLVTYKPEFENYYFKKNHISIVEAWLENYDDELKGYRQDIYNLKFILLVKETNPSDSFFNINWKIINNFDKGCELRMISKNEYFVVLRFDKFVIFDTLKLMLSQSKFTKGSNNEEHDEIKLYKVKN